MGLKRIELLTPSLSEKCSNQLSYSPEYINKREEKKDYSLDLSVLSIHNSECKLITLLPFS